MERAHNVGRRGGPEANIDARLLHLSCEPHGNAQELADEFTSRGQSGSYAAFREIQWLSRTPDEWATPEQRSQAALKALGK